MRAVGREGRWVEEEEIIWRETVYIPCTSKNCYSTVNGIDRNRREIKNIDRQTDIAILERCSGISEISTTNVSIQQHIT